MKKCHAEIEYKTDKGDIHSDICPVDCNFEEISNEYKEFLHICLDEWLNKSNGTGAFYIAEEGYQIK